MANMYYQQHKEKLQKVAQKNIKIFLKKKKTKGRKKPEKDIKILLRKKKKKGITRILLRNKNKS